MIVPVYNPGDRLDACVDSLLGQTMPPGECELVFVDDGSTDGTGERLHALAAEHAHVEVRHIPNSGWPGRPRNVGLEVAAGEFAYFVDHDDWLGPEALERLHAAAVADDADVVAGRVVGHGKTVPRGFFARDRRGVAFDTPELLRLLTPHKLFRRSLLDAHGIRFPEGRRRLEDHVFVVHAYFHARRISVLADYPYYHWVAHGPDANASRGAVDPAAYYADVREVLDVVEAHTEPGPWRDALMAHWYRGKMLGRVGGRGWLRGDREQRRAVAAEVRRLALERFAPGAADGLAYNRRERARVLREGSFEELEALAAVEDGVRLRARAALAGGGELRLRGRVRGVPGGALDELGRPTLTVLLRSHGGQGEYALPARTETAVRGGEVTLESVTRLGSAALPAGTWDVIARANVAGFTAAARPFVRLDTTGDGGARLRRSLLPPSLRRLGRG